MACGGRCASRIWLRLRSAFRTATHGRIYYRRVPQEAPFASPCKSCRPVVGRPVLQSPQSVQHVARSRHGRCINPERRSTHGPLPIADPCAMLCSCTAHTYMTSNKPAADRAMLWPAGEQYRGGQCECLHCSAVLAQVRSGSHSNDSSPEQFL